MRQQNVACRPLERNELFRRGKWALCGTCLLSLALIAAAILAVLSLPPSGILGPEPDRRLIERLRMPIALAAGELERDAPEPSFAIPGPEFSRADALTIRQEVQPMRGPMAGTAVASSNASMSIFSTIRDGKKNRHGRVGSSKRVHIQQGSAAAHLPHHGKRSHTVLAHGDKRPRRAAVAGVRHGLASYEVASNTR